MLESVPAPLPIPGEIARARASISFVFSAAKLDLSKLLLLELAAMREMKRVKADEEEE